MAPPAPPVETLGFGLGSSPPFTTGFGPMPLTPPRFSPVTRGGIRAGQLRTYVTTYVHNRRQAIFKRRQYLTTYARTYVLRTYIVIDLIPAFPKVSCHRSPEEPPADQGLAGLEGRSQHHPGRPSKQRRQLDQKQDVFAHLLVQWGAPSRPPLWRTAVLRVFRARADSENARSP